MHPFDIKSVLLAKHAQHVALIHFPIALVMMGVLFDFLAHWTKNRALAAAAYYNLLAATISTVPALITGVLAWQWVLDGHKIKGVLLLHLVFAGASTVLIWIIGSLHYRRKRTPEAPLPAYRLPIEALAAALTALTGHLGGFLTGVNIPS
jgi:uncharacterized membrane protein